MGDGRWVGSPDWVTLQCDIQQSGETVTKSGRVERVRCTVERQESIWIRVQLCMRVTGSRQSAHGDTECADAHRDEQAGICAPMRARLDFGARGAALGTPQDATWQLKVCG